MNDALIPGPADRGERYTRERCHVREILNDSRVPAVSVARCRVEVGVTTEWHRLPVDEWYLLERGRGCMYLADEPPIAVGPGDTVTIPAGTPQRIANTGGDDLVFQCLCLPRFRPEGYEPLE